MAEFELKIGTAEAKNYASELKKAEDTYRKIVEELVTTKTQIQMNWEGDATDINDIITRIDAITGEFQERIIPSLNKLHVGVTNYATEVEQISNNTTDDQSGGTGGNGGSGTDGGAGSGAGAAKQKPGFWEYHKNNFKNDWDYSGCDSGLDYIGATVDGFIGTVGSATNFVVDGTSEILGWLFG